MFIAAQFTIAKVWKQPTCLSVDEWIKITWYIYTVESYSAVKPKKKKKKEILLFVIAWMDLGSIYSMQSKIASQRKDRYHMTSLICGI